MYREYAFTDILSPRCQQMQLYLEWDGSVHFIVIYIINLFLKNTHNIQIIKNNVFEDRKSKSISYVQTTFG